MSGTPENDTVWTVGRLLDWTTAWFHDRQVEGGRLAAELLLARALSCAKIELYTRYESVPSSEQRAAFRALVRQAGEHTPIAYLLGTREFFSLEFAVSSAVLIPRPETEVLVQRAIEICRASPQRHWQILDVGTGSGCIAIAVARYADNAKLVASDISASAIEVAAANVERHGLQDRVGLVEADGLALPGEVVPADGFDLMVSNPPYISDRVYAQLPPHIRDHEPRVALNVEGGDGLTMYRRFATEAPSLLAPAGRLIVEVGHDQRDAVRAIFESAGPWHFAAAHRDPSDPHDRALEFELMK